MAGKIDIINKVAANTGMTIAEARVAVDETISAIASIAAQERLTIHKFGSFFMRHKPARVYRNPRTGDDVPKASRNVLVFRSKK